MFFNNTQCSSPNDIYDQFVNFFKSVYVCDKCTSNYCLKNSYVNSNLNTCNLYLSAVSILDGLCRIDERKSCGPDKIPRVFLKKCANNLLTPLEYIFNISLSSGIFPDKWKPSYTVPIFKTGNRNNIENYRGIAILSTFGKLFESLVTTFLTYHISSFISSNQHDFMKGRSTCTNLIEFVNFSVGKIEEGAQIDVIYTDICKAFDSLIHSMLIIKLNNIGIHSSMLAWIQSYFSDRQQFVKMGGWTSKPINVTSGVL